jgi:hypothetical protein
VVKLGATNQAHAVSIALKRGLLPRGMDPTTSPSGEMTSGSGRFPRHAVRHSPGRPPGAADNCGLVCTGHPVQPVHSFSPVRTPCSSPKRPSGLQPGVECNQGGHRAWQAWRPKFDRDTWRLRERRRDSARRTR